MRQDDPVQPSPAVGVLVGGAAERRREGRVRRQVQRLSQAVEDEQVALVRGASVTPSASKKFSPEAPIPCAAGKVASRCRIATIASLTAPSAAETLAA
jgi:hypothetical protein